MSQLPSPQSLLRRYFTDLQMQNWSPQTIERRSYSLNRFLAWCSDRGIDSVTEITAEAVEAYRRTLFHYRNPKTGKPLKFGTQAGYLVALRHWFRWLVERQWIAVNPAADLKLPREEHRLPSSYLTQDQVETVLSSVDLTQPAGVRDRAMLETFYSTGIRRSELVRLKLDDIDRGRRLVIIRQGKNRKDRVVPIGRRAVEWIEKYAIEVRPDLVKHDADTLFLSMRGNPLHPNNLSALIRGYLVGVGITERGSCHMLRHTAATLMLEGGADIRSLQQLLGHAQLNTTQIYTHVTIQRLREVHDRTHPGASDRPPAVTPPPADEPPSDPSDG